MAQSAVLRRTWLWITDSEHRKQVRRSRAIEALKRSGFWCDKHWSLLMSTSVDPIEATMNITIGLALIGTPIKGIKAGCCTFTEDTIAGVFERTSPA